MEITLVKCERCEKVVNQFETVEDSVFCEKCVGYLEAQAEMV